MGKQGFIGILGVGTRSSRLGAGVMQSQALCLCPTPLTLCDAADAESQVDSPATHYSNRWDPLPVSVPLPSLPQPAQPLDTAYSGNTNSLRQFRWGKGKELGERHQTLD